MNVSDYFRSLSLELNSLKDRIRNFIADNHWQTDGEWKESVLRTILRRHLPSNIEVGRGFIITPDECSRQIDVLIYDASKPVLHKDGELVFVTSDAVKGIIEVKSKIYRNTIEDVLSKLGDNAEFIYRNLTDLDETLFVGLFAYEIELENLRSTHVLDALESSARHNRIRVVNHLSLGDSFFIRFWETSPHWEQGYNKWRAYKLNRKAPGYFINNVVHAVAEDSVSSNQDVWFPSEGKERYSIEERSL